MSEKFKPYWIGLAFTIIGFGVGFGQLMSQIQNNTIAIQANTKAIVSIRDDLNNTKVENATLKADLNNIKSTVCEISSDVKELLKKRRDD